MEWVLVGYLAKRRAVRDGWKSPWPDHPEFGFPCADPVEEICSVSKCIVAPFEYVEEPGDGNPLRLFPEARRAWEPVPVQMRPDYALYAYRMWPVQYAAGREETMELWWEPDYQPIPNTFTRLGWDAVVSGNGQSFGCSPLSCNTGSDLVRCGELNRYCLVGNPHAAKALAYRFSITEPEPGPYCVVEVWRDLTTVVGAVGHGDPDGM